MAIGFAPAGRMGPDTEIALTKQAARTSPKRIFPSPQPKSTSVASTYRCNAGVKAWPAGPFCQRVSYVHSGSAAEINVNKWVQCACALRQLQGKVFIEVLSVSGPLPAPSHPGCEGAGRGRRALRPSWSAGSVRPTGLSWPAVQEFGPSFARMSHTHASIGWRLAGGLAKRGGDVCL
jgi:hypothetical protein